MRESKMDRRAALAAGLASAGLLAPAVASGQAKEGKPPKGAPSVAILGKVKGLGAKPVDGRVRVTVFPADQPVHLRPAHPLYEATLRALREAREKGHPVVLTITAAGEILSAKPADPAARPDPEARRIAGGDQVSAVTLEEAKRLFQTILEKNKQFREPRFAELLSGRIPFEYPDGGCQARAHEMCRLLREAAVTPMKAWSYAASDDVYIRVRTKNSPRGFVEWDLHVAPALRLRGDAGEKFLVIDPALADGPIEESEWRARQENADQAGARGWAVLERDHHLNSTSGSGDWSAEHDSS